MTMKEPPSVEPSIAKPTWRSAQSSGGSPARNCLDREAANSDEECPRSWMDAEKDEAAFAQFLEDHIYGVRDFTEYLEQCDGLNHRQQLRQRELLLYLGK